MFSRKSCAARSDDFAFCLLAHVLDVLEHAATL